MHPCVPDPRFVVSACHSGASHLYLPVESVPVPVVGTAGDGMSDSDKICLQLYLDVQEYGQQIQRLGLDIVPESMTSYVQLLQSVTPSTQPGATTALPGM